EEGTGARLVAVGRPEREIGTEGTGFFHGAGDVRLREQTGAVGLETRPPVANLLDPVSVEQGGSRGAVSERKRVARGPFVAGQVRFQPVVGDVKMLAALFRA